MDIPEALPATEFVALPIPTESVPTVSNEVIDSKPAVVTMHVGKATVDIPETTSAEFIKKIIGALAYVE